MPNITTLNKWQKRRILKGNRGILSEVARRCKVTPQAVRKIWWGESKSAFITAVLEGELRSRGILNSIEEAPK